MAAPLACLALAYASFSPDKSIQPLIPALKSNWLIAHVITCFLGYAAFAVAFAVSLLYLAKSSGEKRLEQTAAVRVPPLAILDELTHQLVMFGFLFLTAVLSPARCGPSRPGRVIGVGILKRPGR